MKRLLKIFVIYLSLCILLGAISPLTSAEAKKKKVTSTTQSTNFIEPHLSKECGAFWYGVDPIGDRYIDYSIGGQFGYVNKYKLIPGRIFCLEGDGMSQGLSYDWRDDYGYKRVAKMIGGRIYDGERVYRVGFAEPCKFKLSVDPGSLKSKDIVSVKYKSSDPQLVKVTKKGMVTYKGKDAGNVIITLTVIYRLDGKKVKSVQEYIMKLYGSDSLIGKEGKDTISHAKEKEIEKLILKHDGMPVDERQIAEIIDNWLYDSEVLAEDDDYTKIAKISNLVNNKITYDGVAAGRISKNAETKKYFNKMPCVSWDGQSAEVALRTRYAVCAGYASLTVNLCREAGINSAYVYSDSPTWSHAWCNFLVDGTVCSTDPTSHSVNPESLAPGEWNNLGTYGIEKFDKDYQSEYGYLGYSRFADLSIITDDDIFLRRIYGGMVEIKNGEEKDLAKYMKYGKIDRNLVTIKYSSSNSDIATVSDDGKVKGKNPGGCTIRVLTSYYVDADHKPVEKSNAVYVMSSEIRYFVTVNHSLDIKPIRFDPWEDFTDVTIDFGISDSSFVQLEVLDAPIYPVFEEQVLNETLLTQICTAGTKQFRPEYGEIGYENGKIKMRIPTWAITMAAWYHYIFSMDLSYDYEEFQSYLDTLDEWEEDGYYDEEDNWHYNRPEPQYDGIPDPFVFLRAGRELPFTEGYFKALVDGCDYDDGNFSIWGFEGDSISLRLKWKDSNGIQCFSTVNIPVEGFVSARDIFDACMSRYGKDIFTLKKDIKNIERYREVVKYVYVKTLK